MAGSIRSSIDDDMAEAHEINVTPFIDVMLVLLIIFMVAAPLSTVDVPVNLPNAAAPPTERPDEPIIVSLQPDLTLSLGNGVVARETLAARLLAASGNKPDTRIFLRADTTVSYGALMDVMTLLRDGGFTQVALVGLEAAP
ncbi:TonB system transport protein ExbD [Gemmobacter fulvus]|uniref:TonB system transport protein ExbD n=1 Tax=Gemmobacter fulvus TaxID=2840474 RepID=UPI0027969318|nr:TonB system transport protein ExbD [Gemmobacter fulvus]MDQ1847053.1 TonB system transport protein ExbD [Gemmobacter fulvus]